MVFIVMAFFIAILGFLTVKEMIDPVIKISSDARIIAQGNFEHRIQLEREDEIGILGSSLNQLTRRIKENMEEMKTYSEKTKEINLEINKRVLVLSSLLQISNFISQNAELNEILEVSVGKSMQVGEASLGFLLLYDEAKDEYTMKSVHGPKSVEIANRGLNRFKVKAGKEFLGKLVLSNRIFILDNSNKATSEEVEGFRQLFAIVNFLVAPVFLRDRIIGLLGLANDKADFSYPHSDLELIEIFARQIAIAVENDTLLRKVGKLEIRDTLTGLFNEGYIRERLEEEIKRAIKFQRPCAFILLGVDNFGDYRDNFGIIAAESVLKKIAVVLSDSITDIDKAARFADRQFALILPEKNKRQCLEIAEDIRKKIEFLFAEDKDIRHRLTITGSVTENPIDGISAKELITKAQGILEKSMSQGQNRICL
jgi:diguanylate cyclase (GGDEF)-like protein